MGPVPGEKPLYWIGSSLKDITRFPSDVQRSVGFALGAAQYGGKHPAAKPWKGEGPGILEVVKDYDGDTYRAIYTVRFAQAVYVFARLSEEIAARDRNQAIRCCIGTRTFESGAKGLRGEAWLRDLQSE